MSFEETVTSVTNAREDISLFRQIRINCANKDGDVRVSLLKELNPFL
jgi:hypothetical protein